MKKPISIGALGVGASMLAPIATADAHHSEPNCRYGSNVLPDSVTVEAYRMFERCEGPKVTIRLANGQTISLAYTRSYEPTKTEAREQEAKRKKKPKRRCKKARGRRCRR